MDYLRRGSKYGDSSDLIINESFDIFDININPSYDIFLNNVSHITKSSLLLLDEESMLKKHQLENNFISLETISTLRSFLLKSFAEEYQLSNSIDVGSI